MGLRERLERLDGGKRCPECGGPWRPGDPVEYVVDWLTGETHEPLPPCPRCGCEREIVIEFGSAEPLAGGGMGEGGR